MTEQDTRHVSSRRLRDAAWALIGLAGVTMGLYQVRDGIDPLWAAPQWVWTADIILSLVLLAAAVALFLLVGTRTSLGPVVLGVLALASGIAAGAVVSLVRGDGVTAPAARVGQVQPVRTSDATSPPLPSLRVASGVPLLLAIPRPVPGAGAGPRVSVPRRSTPSPPWSPPPAAPADSIIGG